MNGPNLDLSIALERSSVSQLESFKVSVTLTNHGPEALVPSAYDISGALAFFVREGERCVRRASGLTHQEMMIRGRVSAEPSLEDLDSGAHWSVTLDLGQWMYAPPPGRYRLTAELLLPDDAQLTSNELELELTAEAVLWARASRDNPVLDGLALLLERDNAKQPFILRQYNHAKPLAAWYGEAVQVAAAKPTLARPTYFATESFDHFFQRWLVFLERESVVAQAFVNGKPSGARLEAPFPPGHRLLPSACDHGAEGLELFAVAGAELVAFAFAPGTLRERWRLTLPSGADRDPELVGDATGYWVALARAGLHVARVDRAGHAEPWQPRFNSDLVCAGLSIDPVDHRVCAAFWDAPEGRHLQLVEAALTSDRVTLLYQERTGPLASIAEFAFDCDANGTFHLLAHGKDGLFYQRQEGPPFFLAPATAQRAPLVAARPAVHLGFYDAQRGYNFYAFRHGAIQYREPSTNPQEVS